MLGHNYELGVSTVSDGIKIDLTAIPWTELRLFDAWVIKLQHLASDHRNPFA